MQTHTRLSNFTVYSKLTLYSLNIFKKHYFFYKGKSEVTWLTIDLEKTHTKILKRVLDFKDSI